MPWDFEENGPGPPAWMQNIQPMDPSDLESIVTLLELAVIDLTKKRGDQFTKEELVRVARQYGGSDESLRDVDVDIVLPYCGFLLRKVPGGKYVMK